MLAELVVILAILALMADEAAVRGLIHLFDVLLVRMFVQIFFLEHL